MHYITMLFDNVSFANTLACNASECLSWIIVLLNILTVFYLAFCAWFKVTKAVKLSGFVWTAITVCTTVIILFFHTCIFTIISAVFTALISMATLSVVFNHKLQKAENITEVDNEIKGYYVIFNTTDKKYAFRLYDKTKKYFMTSCYKYNSLEEVKKAITICRKNGIDVMLEDQTAEWIKSVNLPKFVMAEYQNKYYNEYIISNELTMLKSIFYSDIVVCTKCVNKVMNAVLSDELFISKDILDGDDFKNEVTNEVVKDSTEEKIEKPNLVAEQNIINSEEEKNDESGVSFNVNTKYTFEEELKMQNKEIKQLYVKLREYAMSKENIKEFASLYKVKFKWGRNDLMHVLFKRGELECRVMAGSGELKRLALQGEGPKIKEQPTKVHLIDNQSFESIINLIDIAYINIEEARKKVEEN